MFGACSSSMNPSTHLSTNFWNSECFCRSAALASFRDGFAFVRSEERVAAEFEPGGGVCYDEDVELGAWAHWVPPSLGS